MCVPGVQAPIIVKKDLMKTGSSELFNWPSQVYLMARQNDSTDCSIDSIQ